MYEKTSACIKSSVSDLRDGNTSQASISISMAEAHLPVQETDKNRIVSRFVTVISSLDSEKYQYYDDVVEQVTEIGEKLAEDIKKDNFNSQEYERLIRNVRDDIELVGGVERVPEDSAWGKIARDIVED